MGYKVQEIFFPTLVHYRGKKRTASEEETVEPLAKKKARKSVDPDVEEVEMITL